MYLDLFSFFIAVSLLVHGSFSEDMDEDQSDMDEAVTVLRLHRDDRSGPFYWIMS